jgi:hypothetical protein
MCGNITQAEQTAIDIMDNLDPECALKNLVINKPGKVDKVDYILNNSDFCAISLPNKNT